MSSRHNRRGQVQEEEVINMITADKAMVMFFSMVVAVMILIRFFNPPVEPVPPQEKAGLYVMAQWDVGLPDKQESSRIDGHRDSLLAKAGAAIKPGHSTADVDLWVAHRPYTGLCEVIGYPSQLQQSRSLKLDEDDRGWNRSDVKDDINREIATSKNETLPEGRYYINVHLFSSAAEAFPIKTLIRITVNRGKPNEKTIEKEVSFSKRGEELVVLQFEIDENGNYVEWTEDDEGWHKIATSRAYNGC